MLFFIFGLFIACIYVSVFKMINEDYEEKDLIQKIKTLKKEIEELTNYSSLIRNNEIKFHKDENDDIASCCSTANLTLTHSIIASASERKKVIVSYSFILILS
jgi:hypothetical protein